jgi:hypothetical protein
MHCGHQAGRHGHGHDRACGCGHRHHSSYAANCGCHSFHFGPRFPTREEKVSWLEQYLEGLQEEAKAVEERIAKLKAE